jgi:glycosyltransferase involved in cell wall biosynthesis
MEKKISDISVVVCTKNSEDSIKDVIKSVLANMPLELIMVDANSTDNTRKITEKYNVRILTDPGLGLAVARNIGLKEVRGKYAFFIGSDNIIRDDALGKLKEYIIKHNYVGASALTRVRERKHSYWSRGMDMRWYLRFYEGPRDVIGTPYIFKTDILKKYYFDPKMSWSDDSDLAVKLARDGHRVGYSNIVCEEIGKNDFKSILYRFRMYGKSDYEYYAKFSLSWKLKRKIKSIFHPIRVELIQPMVRIKKTKLLFYIPFFCLITILRYRGYIGFFIRWGKTRKNEEI